MMDMEKFKTYQNLIDAILEGKTIQVNVVWEWREENPDDILADIASGEPYPLSYYRLKPDVVTNEPAKETEMTYTSVFQEYRHIIDAMLDGKTIQLAEHPDSKFEAVKWVDLAPDLVLTNIASFTNPASNYRIKPVSVKINRQQFFPLSEPPEIGDIYFVARPDAAYYFSEQYWEDLDGELGWLKRGLLFSTAEEAARAGEALLHCVKFEN